ncbi:MAG: diguanylate cyclase [Nitrosomonadales bacterium]|nr:diguanylate cyclase [Nitrosomonadales bacterium]
MQTTFRSFLRRPAGHLSFVQRLVAGIFLINLLVIGLAAFTTHEDLLEHEGHARTTTQNLSLLLSRDLGAVFDRSDLVLRTVADEIEQQFAAGAIRQKRLTTFLKQQQSHLPEAISLRVTDEKGLVLYGEGVKPGTPVDISDREHFIRQQNNPQAGLVIAQPVMARISKQWAIPLSRRINLPNGDFAGIAYINIPVAYFVKKFATLNWGANGVIAMRSANHISMARFPEIAEGAGTIGQFAISDQLRSLLKDDPNNVTYVAPSPTDGIERIFSYQKFADYPLYVVTGLAKRDILAEWQWDASRTAIFVALFILTSILFAWLLVRSWHRQLAVGEILRASEQRWSFALESGNFTVWDWNIPTGKVQLSKLGKQLFGYGENDIGDQMTEWAALCHPDDKEHVLACIKDHFRGKTPSLHVEYRVRCKDGSWKWILTRGLVMDRAMDGKPLRMIGLHSDISERKKREEELRLSSTVFNLANEAMIVTNPQNTILSVNPAFTAITGYAPEEAIGRNPKMLSAKQQTKEFYQELWTRLTQTGSWSGEVLNRKKNGELYVEWLSIKRVLNENGELTHHVAVFSDITARKDAEDRIRHQALHDSLTDLPNRTLLTERLERAIVRAKRDNSYLGLLFFDLDKFKPINDNYGHEVGDWLLKSVALRAVGCIRESDTVARLGGDEFVVLLPKLANTQDALAVAEKIRDALAQPFIFAETSFEISASIGVVIYPEHGADEKTLARNADAAMYRAKKAGRNQVVLYQAGMNTD